LAWFVQVVGREYRLVGYYESSGAPLGHYIDKVNEFKSKHKVRFGNHYLPHDTRQRELIAGMSRFETLRSLGIEPKVVPAHHLQDGINAVRRMLDRSIIDPARCAEGLDLLRNYKYEWQERKRIWSPHPRHDFASHCADALRCFASRRSF
jgi:phage terminase large subunit